jgi:hypothetical protein
VNASERNGAPTFTVQVDRIEGDVAVLLWGDETVDVPRAWLPPGAGEGASLLITLQRDPDAEEALRRDVQARLARLAGDDPGEDEIDL